MGASEESNLGPRRRKQRETVLPTNAPLHASVDTDNEHQIAPTLKGSSSETTEVKGGRRLSCSPNLSEPLFPNSARVQNVRILENGLCPREA